VSILKDQSSWKKRSSRTGSAVFQNSAVSIEFARKTTLAQLAEQLRALGEIHAKLLLPVQVRVAAPVYSSGKQLSRHVAE
jgi:hypothetical protein